MLCHSAHCKHFEFSRELSCLVGRSLTCPLTPPLRHQENRPAFQAYVRHRFKENAQVPRTEVARVEYILRQGRKQLDVLKQEDVKSISL